MGKENPIGLKGIDHLEFTCANLNSPCVELFKTLGFTQTHQNKQENAILLNQGQIRFLVKASNKGQSAEYFKNHGEGVNKISFAVENAEQALAEAVRRGAKEVQNVKKVETANGIIRTSAIQGFGDVINEYIEKENTTALAGFEKCDDPSARPLQVRFSRIDHLTNNVPYGEMDHWVDFYKRVYDFRETRYFDIKGVNTGLFSKVVQSHDNNIIIPINQPEVPNGKSQIQEFLDMHKGAGVQHIALMTPDIMSSVRELRERMIRFLKTPHTYYEDIPKRLNNVTESIDALEQLQLLADGDEAGYLLQIFSETYIGPLFFEFIQRKNHWGFGEGNFQALFDSIERDQKERGYL
jgi:4-hydroxyphenylpyruvate dioxygenase